MLAHTGQIASPEKMKTLTVCVRQTSRKIRGVESDYADIAFLGMRSKVRNYSYSPNHTAINLSQCIQYGNNNTNKTRCSVADRSTQCCVCDS